MLRLETGKIVLSWWCGCGGIKGKGDGARKGPGHGLWGMSTNIWLRWGGG